MNEVKKILDNFVDMNRDGKLKLILCAILNTTDEQAHSRIERISKIILKANPKEQKWIN